MNEQEKKRKKKKNKRKERNRAGGWEKVKGWESEWEGGEGGGWERKEARKRIRMWIEEGERKKT